MSVPGMLPPAAWGDAGGSSTLIQTLQSLGLTSGLQLCLDAGDASSYSGSGQTWSDVSGNGNDFYRGTSSSSQSSDPTFNGAAGTGGSSNYWSFDGGDYFTLAAGTNPSWVNNLHKAGQTQTILLWVYIASLSPTSQGLVGDSDAASPGLLFWIRNDGYILSELENGSTSTSNATFSVGPVSTGAWHLLGATLINTNGSTAIWQVDGASASSTLSIPFTPSSAVAPLPLRIGYNGGSYSGTVDKITSGSRIGNVTIWQGVGLTAANMTAIYNATKAGYGL